MKLNPHSYSQTTTFVLAVLIAILFGWLGYWYGTNHSGGFSTISISDLDLNLNGSARDHPGEVSRSNLNNNEFVYNNQRIGLTFTVPEKFFIKDFWPEDAADLMITANQLEHQIKASDTANNEKDQVEISYYSSLAQFDYLALGAVDFEDWIDKYSNKTNSDLEGKVIEPTISKAEKVTVGNKVGYKAKKPDSDNETVYLIKTSRGYFEITTRVDDSFTSETEKEIIENMKF